MKKVNKDWLVFIHQIKLKHFVESHLFQTSISLLCILPSLKMYRAGSFDHRLFCTGQHLDLQIIKKYFLYIINSKKIVMASKTYRIS